MAMHYIINEDCGAVFVVGKGRVSNGALLQCVADIRSDARLSSDMPTLIDFSEVVQMDVTPDGIRRLVRFLNRTNDQRGNAKLAFVVNKTGIAVMVDLFAFSSAGAGLNQVVQLFQNVPDALAWTGISEIDHLESTSEIVYDKCSGM